MEGASGNQSSYNREAGLSSFLPWGSYKAQTETGKRLTRTDGRELACYPLTDLLSSLIGFLAWNAFGKSVLLYGLYNRLVFSIVREHIHQLVVV